MKYIKLDVILNWQVALKLQREYNLTNCAYYILHNIYTLTNTPNTRLTNATIYTNLKNYNPLSFYDGLNVLLLSGLISFVAPDNGNGPGKIKRAAKIYTLTKRGYEVIYKYIALMSEGIPEPINETGTTPEPGTPPKPTNERATILRLLKSNKQD